MGKKDTSGPDPRERVKGPQTTLDNENSDKGFPTLTGLLYQLSPGPDGLAFSRPFFLTSVDSRNQHVNGWVLPEPEDKRGGPFFVKDVRMGGPGESETVHWAPRWYTGRSDGPTLTPADEEPTVVGTVSEGNS